MQTSISLGKGNKQDKPAGRGTADADGGFAGQPEAGRNTVTQSVK